MAVTAVMMLCPYCPRIRPIQELAAAAAETAHFNLGERQQMLVMAVMPVMGASEQIMVHLPEGAAGRREERAQAVMAAAASA
jgi:hypothetical protein